MANFLKMEAERRSEFVRKTGLHLTYKPSFDLPDHKGVDVFLGQRCEGGIVYHSVASDLVADGTLDPGWHWYKNHIEDASEETGNDEPFESFELAAKDFERAFFKECFKEAGK